MSTDNADHRYRGRDDHRYNGGRGGEQGDSTMNTISDRYGTTKMVSTATTKAVGVQEGA